MMSLASLTQSEEALEQSNSDEIEVKAKLEMRQREVKNI